MADQSPRARKPRDSWRVVGGLNVDLPRDPYPFAENWGGATQRNDVPRRKDRPPGWRRGRELEDVLREVRDEYRATHVERWPFGPSEQPGAGLVARFAINRKWGLKDATELQVQLNRRTGRAEWIAIRSPKGLLPSEVARLPWANLFTVADATDKLERGQRSRVGSLHEILEMTQPPKAPTVTKRPGRRGHPDEHYARVAKRYMALRARGVTNPTKTIADEWHQARSTVAGWVHEARNRGYLGAASPGRAG